MSVNLSEAAHYDPLICIKMPNHSCLPLQTKLKYTVQHSNVELFLTTHIIIHASQGPMVHN